MGKAEWEEKLDEFPIYLLDLQEAAEPFHPLGNFKKYLTLAGPLPCWPTPAQGTAGSGRRLILVLGKPPNKTQYKTKQHKTPKIWASRA